MRAAARRMLHLTAAIYSARKAVRRPALEEVSARFSPMMADLISRCWEDEHELRPAGDAVVMVLEDKVVQLRAIAELLVQVWICAGYNNNNDDNNNGLGDRGG